MTQFTRRTILSAATLAIAAPAIIGRAQAAATVLKFATSWPNDPKYSTARIWYDLFLPHLQKATEGAVTVDFYPDSQLGQDADIMGQLKVGAVDMFINGLSIWSNIVPEAGIFDLGYLVKDFAHLRRASTTPAVANMEKALLQRGGVHFPGWIRPAGARNILSKAAFVDPAGLKGMQIRTVPNKTVTETVRLMGASPTPLAFGECYTALQAGVIAGLEHDAPTIVTSKFYETTKNLTLTGHLIQPIVITTSDLAMKRLKPNLRDAVTGAIRATTEDVYRNFEKLETQAMTDLKGYGVNIVECDRNAFRQRVQPLWESFVKELPNSKPIMEAIRETENA